MNNKKNTKRVPQGAPLLFIYEMSIVVLIDFIALLLTPDIFSIQFFKINNTNVYLFHFHSKNIIKMRFPKVKFLRFKLASNIHYPSYRGEINCSDISKEFTTKVQSPI